MENLFNLSSHLFFGVCRMNFQSRKETMSCMFTISSIFSHTTCCALHMSCQQVEMAHQQYDYRFIVWWLHLLTPVLSFFYWQDLSIHALQVKEHWPDEILSRALEDICLEKSYQEKCVFVLVHALQSYEDRMSKRKLKAVDCSSSLMPRYQLMVSSVLLTTLPSSFPGQCHFLLCIMGSEDLYLMLYWLLITIVDHVHCFFESCSANMKKKIDTC